jgi:GAF domain-containing protein
MSQPIPENESERLNTLRGYQILDTHPEDRFDDLTRLAASICRTPISLISLVDEDRQWFKSKIGVEMCQTSREEAFCAHAIMSPELFVVPDASHDPRFAANPLVLGKLHIRFYAGAPLTAPNGHHLGALCVIDRVPRKLSREQLESLRILSRQVMAQVVLGKNLHDLKAALQARDDLEGDREKLIKDFQEATATVTTLKGLVPICAGCKKVRNDRGYWEQIERYITNSTGLDTTSCFCPECLRKISERRAGDAVSRK